MANLQTNDGYALIRLAALAHVKNGQRSVLCVSQAERAARGRGGIREGISTTKAW